MTAEKHTSKQCTVKRECGVTRAKDGPGQKYRCFCSEGRVTYVHPSRHRNKLVSGLCWLVDSFRIVTSVVLAIESLDLAVPHLEEGRTRNVDLCFCWLDHAGRRFHRDAKGPLNGQLNGDDGPMTLTRSSSR